MTPFEKLPSLGAEYGLNNLYIKDEGVIPTGSFKTRGASVGISMAKEQNGDANDNGVIDPGDAVQNRND
jgi:threonine synthase